MVEHVYRDRERCVRAVHSRDARFDGWFFTAVTSTRIYCRPSCPAIPPKVENMTFYPSAAAAQQAGFRACKRCRPDAGPGSPRWNERADVVARAMRLIADGVIDRDGVVGLATRLGYSTRQVERQLRAELGAGPLALARAQRAQTARLMIETTPLPMSDVAMAAGFSSIRAFNGTLREIFGTTPTRMRDRAGAHDASPGAPGDLRLRLPFRGPLCAESLFRTLAVSAVPGVEEWRDGTYRRTLALPHGHGIVALTPPRGGEAGYVECRLSLTDFRDLSLAISRCRRLLDLDADPVAVAEHLSTDPVLGPLVLDEPGRRIPRTVDPAELAVRTVLTQNLPAVAGRTLTAALVRDLGAEITDSAGGLTHLFPSVETLAGADPAAWPMPVSRGRAVIGLARGIAEGEIVLDAGADWGAARRALRARPGIDARSAELIAMRALGDPDAFPATDPGLLAASVALGVGVDAQTLETRAQNWSPWRSYAVQYLLAGRETSAHCSRV